MNTIDCTIKLSDVQLLVDLISQKILSDRVVCNYLIECCERVFYDAYHEHSSDVFPLKFMMDKIRRLGLQFITD